MFVGLVILLFVCWNIIHLFIDYSLNLLCRLILACFCKLANTSCTSFKAGLFLTLRSLNEND